MALDRKQKDFLIELIKEFKKADSIDSRNLLLELADRAGIDLAFYVELVDTFVNDEATKFRHAKEVSALWNHLGRMTWIDEAGDDSMELERLKSRYKEVASIARGFCKCT